MYTKLQGIDFETIRDQDAPFVPIIKNRFDTSNFDEPDDLILNARIGIRVPVIFGFETEWEAKLEYDGGAVEDVDDLDETYNFRIKYAW